MDTAASEPATRRESAPSLRAGSSLRAEAPGLPGYAPPRRGPLAPRVLVTRLSPCPVLPGEDGAALEGVFARLPVPARGGREFFREGEWFVKGSGARGRRGVREGWRRARRILGEARALRRMADLGLPVPEVAAYGVETVGGFARRAFLVERWIEGTVKLGRFLQDCPDPALRRAALAEAGRVVARMHGVGLFHRDLSLRNLLVRPRGGGVEVFLIDAPQAAWGALPFRRGMFRRADLLRLARGLRTKGLDPAEAAAAFPGMPVEEVRGLLGRAREERRRGRTPDVAGLLWVWFGV